MMRMAAWVVAAMVLGACGGKTPPPSEPSGGESGSAGGSGSDGGSASGSESAGGGGSGSAAGGGSGSAVGGAASDAGVAPSTVESDAGAPAAAGPTADAGPAFDMQVVEGVLKEHKEALRQACWVRAKSTEKAYIGTMSIRLAPTGKVISVQTDGTDPPTSKCIDKEAKAWKFPPPSGTASIKLPIRMRRD